MARAEIFNGHPMITKIEQNLKDTETKYRYDKNSNFIIPCPEFKEIVK
jgi:hypothetical protein